MEMEEAASTNLSTPFHHRMTHNTAQDAVFNKCHRRKYVSPGVASIGRKAAEIHKGAAQAFLSLITWSE